MHIQSPNRREVKNTQDARRDTFTIAHSIPWYEQRLTVPGSNAREENSFLLLEALPSYPLLCLLVCCGRIREYSHHYNLLVNDGACRPRLSAASNGLGLSRKSCCS